MFIINKILTLIFIFGVMPHTMRTHYREKVHSDIIYLGMTALLDETRQKAKRVALSSTEAELLAAAEGIRNALYLKKC